MIYSEYLSQIRRQPEVCEMIEKLDSIWLLLLIFAFMYFVFRLAKSYMYMRMRRAHRLTGLVSKFNLFLTEIPS